MQLWFLHLPSVRPVPGDDRGAASKLLGGVVWQDIHMDRAIVSRQCKPTFCGSAGGTAGSSDWMGG